MREKIPINDQDLREGLRLLREKTVAEKTMQLFIEQMAAIYNVPAGYTLLDFQIGFEPVEGIRYD